MSKTTVFTLTVSVALVATTPTLNVSPTAVAAGGMVTRRVEWNCRAKLNGLDWSVRFECRRYQFYLLDVRELHEDR